MAPSLLLFQSFVLVYMPYTVISCDWVTYSTPSLSIVAGLTLRKLPVIYYYYYNLLL